MKIKHFFALVYFFAPPFYGWGQYYDAENRAMVDKSLFTNSKCDRQYYNYFYSVDGKYPQSSETIRKNVRAFLANQKVDIKGSGYINFNFGIGCDGKLSRNFNVTQTDEKYGLANFDPSIIETLYAFLKTMDKWKICIDQNKKPTNYIAFLSFKIKDGKIINIIP
jgi:hypothetical protein